MTMPERLMVRNGTFYFRMRVPKDIAPIYGRRLVVRSLRTKDFKSAKSQLPYMIVAAEKEFNMLRSPPSLLQPGSDLAQIAELARTYGKEVSEKEFAERADLFRAATEQPSRFWRGDLGALPQPADFGHGEADSYTYFDHLVAEGDLETVIAYVNQFRRKKRVEALAKMSAAGNIEEFVILAQQRVPGLGEASILALARLLLSAERDALASEDRDTKQNIPSQGRPFSPARPSAEDPGSDTSIASVKVAGVSLDELFTKWEAEGKPSASTLSS